MPGEIKVITLEDMCKCVEPSKKIVKRVLAFGFVQVVTNGTILLLCSKK